MNQSNSPWSSGPSVDAYAQRPSSSFDAENDLYGTGVSREQIPVPKDPDFWRISPEYPHDANERKRSSFSLGGRMNRVGYILRSILHAVIIGAAVGLAFFEMATYFVPVASLLIVLAVLWANLTLQVKRAHDAGLSGLWLLTYFIPPISPVIPFLVLLWPGQPHANRYGNPPS